MPRPRKFKMDPIYLVTTPIDVKNDGNGGGTGFFFNYNESTYLITNSHVLTNKEKLTEEVIKNTIEHPPQITYYIRDGTEYKSPNRLSVDLSADNIQWRFNSNGADIAIVRLNQQLADIWDVYKGEILTSFSLALTEQELLDNMRLTTDRVFTLGYPGRVYDSETKFPIRRSAMIASPFSENFDNERKFLVDARMDSGTSGSPLLVNSRNVEYESGEHLRRSEPVPLLLGVHSGNMILDGFFDSDDEVTDRNVVFSDINEIWYADKIIETIENLNNSL